MSSSILYKFRSSSTFEALPLPGTAARLFDVKKAIVKAKRLDVGGMDFELEVHDATTNQQYVDESMLLPRGTRLVVRRVGATRGQGFVARMQRAESGASMVAPPPIATAPSNFYTIESRERDDEDDFVPANSGGREEDKELAALMAVTEASHNPAIAGRPVPVGNMHRPAGSGPPPQMAQRPGNFQKQHSFRPNADPELRAQEQHQMPKKRATGIPRTFLNLSAPPVTDGSRANDEGAENVPRLQPNALGFEELVNRGGGQSENTSGTKKDLDYALKLTATPIPEHLQCGICHGVVKNAMLLPWDIEGRTACETCIRDALTQNGFRCPLTGNEGVSPDDLLPNQPLRKAADLFIQGVMEKMDEIDKQQVEEPDQDPVDRKLDAGALFEGDSADKGVIVSKKTIKEHRSKRQDDDDPFGGEDDFGGDVFDVAAEKENHEDDATETTKAITEKEQENEQTVVQRLDDSKNYNIHDATVSTDPNHTHKKGTAAEEIRHGKSIDDDLPPEHVNPSHISPQDKAVASRREGKKPRGPPAGYAMGPAGSAAVRGAGGGMDRGLERGGADEHHGGRGRSGYGGRGWDRRFWGRGRGGRQGRYFDGGGRYGDYRGRGGTYYRDRYVDDNDENPSSYEQANNDDENRGTKRNRSGSEDGPEDRHRRGPADPSGSAREWPGRERDPWHYGGDRYDDRRNHIGHRGRGRAYRGGRGAYGRY